MPRRLRFAVVATSLGFGQQGSGQQRGTVLADLTWVEAEKVLKPETVVAIPIGADPGTRRCGGGADN